MNQYLKELNKIEFVVTNACTGRCKHCSEGDHLRSGERIDPEVAADVVIKVSKKYSIKTVMTFGGEPLLYPDAVYAIHRAATEMGVPKRQLITNGFFSKNEEHIKEVAKQLKASGVNDTLLSADYFHQETIPIKYVKMFARAALDVGLPIRIQPAWLVSQDTDNEYNRVTHEIIREFLEMGICANQGNVIFPEGNALKYLSEYFEGESGINPYIEDPSNVRTLSFAPGGDVLGGNVYKTDIIELIKNYAP